MNICIENTPTERKCTKCKVVSPLNTLHFSRDKNRKYGFMYKCKVCEKNRKDNRTHRWVNMPKWERERAYANNRAYAITEKGRATQWLSAYKKIDKDKGQETTVTKEDVISCRKSMCVYCGYPATGFDRIDNNIGHTKENCVPACKECNVARMDNFTHEETKIIGQAIKTIKENRAQSDSVVRTKV